ncbi:YheC/YheD family protein [Metabacillus mangrovi]|nr:YheC/YheD family protein [Metabacillus mangrovi]
MKWKKTDLFLHDDTEPSVKISTGLLTAFGKSSFPRVCNLGIGRNSVKARLVIINDSSSFLSVSRSALPVPDEMAGGRSLFVSVRRDSIAIGPLFAVLIGSGSSKESVSLPNMEDYCRELADYCRNAGCLFYLFSLKDWQDGYVNGWILRDGSWRKASMPYPDAVHNRVHQRKSELSLNFIALEEKMKQAGIPFFNSRFLNKWEVHEWLSDDPVLLPYLPASAKLTSKRDYQNYTRSYSDFFIKPVYGSQGKKIFRFRETEDGYWLDDTSSAGGPLLFREAEDAFTYMHPRLTKEPYLLQETIRIQKYRGKPLDFRILCHKKEEGWTVTSMTARVSAENSFVSNLYQGGAAYPVKKVLTELYGDRKARHIRKMLAELSEEVCLAIDRKGCFGELGIDLTVDEDERIWLIEVNSKPSKNSEYVMDGPKIRPSAKAVADYGMYLSMVNGV